MPVRTKAAARRRVAFPFKSSKNNNINNMSSSSVASSSSANANANTNTTTTTTTTDEVADEEIISAASKATYYHQPAFMIPDLFTELPPVRDALVTETSKQQDKTADLCLSYLAGDSGEQLLEYNEHGVPRLRRDSHVRFLHKSLGPLPAGFMAADASRPWFLYWALSALVILGEDVSHYREAVAETARAMQNDSGGFGGGGRQLSHLATTYAIVLSIALVGDEDAYEVIDRKAMWRWLCSLKQTDGGFQLGLGGEEDIRGAYCAAVIITLLNIPLELTPESPAWKEDGSATLFTGLAGYVRRCQTFEGGISGQPDVEAHGAYAFCALGCLALLDHPRRIIPRYLNVPRLVSWMSSRQYAPEGGFSGRTNKLVDGCYSHWVGGCFPLIEACLSPVDEDKKGGTAAAAAASKLPPAPESLFSREGLIRYILCCCQDTSKRGGLRDKPGKLSDAYHSCYVLSGLSSAQHQWELAPSEETSPATGRADPVWRVMPYLEDNDENDVQIFDQKDRLRPIHPVYAIPIQSQEAIRDYFLVVDGLKKL